MSTRRHLLQTGLAASSLALFGQRARTQDRYDQAAILAPNGRGDVTLIHLSDLRGQAHPAYFRPSDTRINVGTDIDKGAFLTAEALRIRYGIGGRTPMDYALTHEDFTAQARIYGPMGGVAHIATAVKAMRAVQPDALFLVGGALFGAAGRGIATLAPDFSAQNKRPDAATGQTVQTDAGISTRIFDRNGHKVGFLALPAGGRPDVDRLQQQIDQMRGQGAVAVVVMSRLGLHSDTYLARDVLGIDVILSGHSHRALPEALRVGATQIICSGGQGQFLGRVELDITDGTVEDVRQTLIPIFAQIIQADPTVQRHIKEPADRTALAHAGEMLYRGGTLTASWDRLLCDAMMAQTGSDVAMVDGVRWGGTILPGQDVRLPDVQNVLRGGPLHAARSSVSGRDLLALIDDAAEGAFSRDPYRRHGRDMARFGGVAFAVQPKGAKGARISDVRMAQTGAPIDPNGTYTLAKWHLNEDPAQGIPMLDIVRRYLAGAQRAVASAPLVTLRA